MSIFRDHMRKGHRVIHQKMAVPVLYIVSDDPGPAIDITARIHNAKHGATGEIGGRNNNWMNREDILNPTATFMRADLVAKTIVPKRGDIISVQAGEAYEVDRDAPPDDDSIILYLNLMDPADTAGLPVPEETP